MLARKKEIEKETEKDLGHCVEFFKNYQLVKKC